MNALEQLKGFASAESTRDITILDDNGNPQVFKLRKFNSAPEGLDFAKKVQKRLDSLKTSANKLECYIPSEIVEQYPDYFNDAVASKSEGKHLIFLKSEEEVAMATTLEHGIVEPVFDWHSAVIYTRVNFRLCGTLAKEINVTNGTYAIEEAKND
jgi:hypothetical protein